MKSIASFCAGCLLLSTLAGAQGPPPAVEPRISFGAAAVRVAGLSPGTEVAWFGATQELAGDDIAEIRLYARVEKDLDRDGGEELPVEGGVPLHGTWVAVDLTSGKVAAASPPGYPLRRVPWRGRGVRRGADGRDFVEDARFTAALLVVRPGGGPGAGVWLLEAGDGAEGDEDGTQNGRIRWQLSSLVPLGGTTSAPPEKLEGRDVVTVLDARALEVTVGHGAN